MERRASLYTVGCRLNQAETAIFSDRLKQSDFQLVPFGQPTDLFVLNTCSVTHGAEAECRRAIRRTLQHSPDAFIAVTGCYAQTGTHALSSIPGVDLIVGSQHKMNVLDFIPSLKKRSASEVVRGNPSRDDFVIDGVGDFTSTRATLKVQDGCDFMCAFCNIPFARGRERSRKLDDLLREASALVDRGHKEIVLSGVNIGQYDADEKSLLDVIQSVEAIPGIARIRISSIEPTTISDGLLKHMAQSEIVCRYLHIPLQSGSDVILDRMHRRYGVEEYRLFVEMAARMIPDLCLGTDVMVGFPGEGDDEFEQTVSVLSQLPFSYFHVFSYSERVGTAAEKYENKVSAQLIQRRSRLLRELSSVKRLTHYQGYAGKTVSVIFEQQDADGYWRGLTDTYVRVCARSDDDLHRQVRLVEIVGVAGDRALGELVAPREASRRELVMVS